MSFLSRLFGKKTPEPAEPSVEMAKPIDVSLAGMLLSEWEKPGFEWNEAGQLRFVRELLPRHVGQRLAPLLVSETFKGNPWCSPANAAALFALIAEYEPTRMMEVGSGYTTLVFAHAKQVLNLPGELIAVDPEPRTDVSECVDALLSTPVQQVPVEDFQILMDKELLFIDSTHQHRPGSDVAYLVDTVLPALNPGVIVGFHGILAPRNYGVEELSNGWNEQDRLLEYLAKNPKIEVLYSGGWMQEYHPGEWEKALPKIPNEPTSTALYIRLPR